jgi:phage head maturation protease
MLLALEDGSVDEMSFAFRVTRQMWSPDYDQRDILEVDLHRGDVSVVNFGANPATSVAPALRAADFDKLGDDDARALLERLQRRLSPPVDPEQPAGHLLSLYQAQAAALAL